jgi:hypothetical protein
MRNKKPNHLSSAEIEVEGNYNAVGDGIINNVKKPSVIKHLEKYDKRKKERHKEEFIIKTQNRRKSDTRCRMDNR